MWIPLKNFCNATRRVWVCIVLVHYGPFPQEINGKSVKLTVWAVSLNFCMISNNCQKLFESQAGPASGELWPTCQPAYIGYDDQVEEADKESLKEGIVHIVLLHLLEDQDDHWQISGIFLEGHITTLWSLGHCVSSHFFFWFKRKRAGNTWVIFVIIWNLIWTIRKCL